MMRPPDALAQLTLVPTSAGGRKSPIYSGYRPHLRSAGQENGVTVDLLEVESLAPGATANVELRFHAPSLLYERFRVGDAFELTEGSTTVATGFLSDVLHRALLSPKDSDKRVVFVDVDDTLIRTAASKRIPIQRSIDFVSKMHSEGHLLYLWSRGGAEYAQEVATELGIADFFQAFLPKPDIVFDDQKELAFQHCDFRHPNAP